MRLALRLFVTARKGVAAARNRGVSRRAAAMSHFSIPTTSGCRGNWQTQAAFMVRHPEFQICQTEEDLDS